MKKLLTLSILVLLTGCVTYYQPDTALEDGVYYAEDDPAYILNAGDYSGIVYYPWSSLDYFYLGYGAYYRYGFTYGYPYGWVYSPWGYPYYYANYYSPWPYPSYHHAYWRHQRGDCSQNSRHRDCRDHDDDHDQIARDDRESDRSPGEATEDYTQTGDGKPGKKRPPPYQRYIWTGPGGYTSNQAMVMRNREAAKIGQSRPGTVKPVRSRSAVVSPSPSAISRPATVTAAPRVYSGSNTRSRSMYSSPRQPRSTSSKSSRRRDRD